MYASGAAHITGPLPVTMRTIPTLTMGGTSNTYYISNIDGATTGTVIGTGISANIVDLEVGSLAGSAVGYPVQYNGQMYLTAEL